MPKITLPQKNIIIEVSTGTNLMAVLRENQISVASSCLGDGVCGKCRMTILGAISQPSEIEKQTLKRNHIGPSERLSCQIAVTCDLSVTTTYW